MQDFAHQQWECLWTRLDSIPVAEKNLPFRHPYMYFLKQVGFLGHR